MDLIMKPLLPHIKIVGYNKILGNIDIELYDPGPNMVIAVDIFKRIRATQNYQLSKEKRKSLLEVVSKFPELDKVVKHLIYLLTHELNTCKELTITITDSNKNSYIVTVTGEEFKCISYKNYEEMIDELCRILLV